MTAKVKYHQDTPVTMLMLHNMMLEASYHTAAECIESHMYRSNTKISPQIGELWLCLIKSSVDRIALWNTTEGWTVYQSGASEPWSTDEIMPLERLIPAEGSDE